MAGETNNSYDGPGDCQLPEGVVVDQGAQIRDVMHNIERVGGRSIVVVDEDCRLTGTVSDGDIRRGILNGASLLDPIETVMNTDPISVPVSKTGQEWVKASALESLRQRTQRWDGGVIPVVDDDRTVVDVLNYPAERESLPSGTDDGQVETVLVIGGAGYLGSVLCRKLLEEGYEVRVLDNLTYGDRGIESLYENDKFSLHEGDMRSIESVTDAIRGVDAVVDLGALVGDPASSIDPKKTMEMNYHSVKMAGEICKYYKIPRFIFASTCSVYGQADSPDELLTETSKLNPVSLYGQTKIESEQALLEMADKEFSPTILRFATIYGSSPRMRFDLVVNILTAKAVTQGTIPIYGGDQYRPNVHVSDAAQAFVDCLAAPRRDVGGEVFNVGSNEQNYRVVDLGRIVQEVVPEAEIDRQSERDDPRSYQVDFSKIRETLGYTVENTVSDGVREIRSRVESGEWTDFNDRRYSNVRSLEDSSLLHVDTVD